jgi:toxin ParE1/3/4
VKRLFLSAEARQDVRGIWRYTAKTWGQDQADRYALGIRAMFTRLVAGQVVSRSADEVQPGLRKMPIGRHVVFFRETEERVEVVRVLHERMDVGRVE